MGGVYTVTLAVAISAGALVAPLLGSRRVRLGALILAAALWLAGFALWEREWTQPIREPVTVAIVQGAVPQEMKWDAEQFAATLDLYRRLMQLAPGWLAPNALCLFEIEATRGIPALNLAYDMYSEAEIHLHKDLTGLDRLLEIRI